MDKILYDAFISYSHSEPDSYIAEKLHVMLEHYHISGKIQEISGKKKISRVFRDREELPLSSDLAANIKDALEHSEYLIVICSPRAVRSEWVKREIETFLKTHEKDKVLTLLADGEPEESFPEILCYSEEKVTDDTGEKRTVRVRVEPMAADVRGKTRREMKKKLKKEFLRILAPMLSCTYDTLRQRHREYLFRRGIAVTGAAAVLAAMFTVYAFHQAAVSEGRYQEARRNQARYLSQISGELLDEGDREGALKTALAVRTETEEDTPVVPEQMYALNNALYSYDSTDRIYYRPACAAELDGKIEAESWWKGSRLSPEENEYFCVDHLGNAYVLDPADGTCIWKIRPGDIEEIETDKFDDFFPVSENTAVLLCGSSIVYVNWQEKNVIRVIEDENLDYSEKAAALCGERIALTDGCYVWVFDLGTGSCLQKVKYYDGDYNSYRPADLSFSEDGSMLACGVSVDYNDIEPQRGFMLLSVDTGEMQIVSERETSRVLFLGEKTVAAVHYDYPDRAEASKDAPKRSFTVTVYDLNTDSILWESEPYRTQAMNNPCELKVESMKSGDDLQDVLVAAVKDRICVFDQETGELLQERNYPENICGVYRYDDSRLLVGLKNGSIRLCTMKQMSTEYDVGAVSAEIATFTFSQKNNTVIWPISESSRIVTGKMFQDENMTGLSLEESICDVEYFTVQDENGGDETTYRCVSCTAQSGGFSAEMLKIYKAGSTDLLFEYKCPQDDQWISEVHIQNVEGHPAALISTYGEENNLIMADLGTGGIVWEYNDLRTSAGQIIKPYFFREKEKILLCDSRDFVMTDLSYTGLTIPDTAAEGIPVNSVEKVMVSADERFIVFETYEGQEKAFRVWDADNEKWTAIEDAFSYTSGSTTADEACIGYESSIMAVYSENGAIDLIDLEKGQVVRSFPCGYYSSLCIEFMNHDRYLVVCGDGSSLMLLDTQTGEILMQDKGLDTYSSVLVTEGSEHFFSIGFYGYAMDDNRFVTSDLHVYYVDDDGRFYPYTDIPYGYAGFKAEEIFTAFSGGYFVSPYTYRELCARAEDVLGGETLTEAEKKQYFVSE